jgi:hypothetical protein
MWVVNLLSSWGRGTWVIDYNLHHQWNIIGGSRARGVDPKNWHIHRKKENVYLKFKGGLKGCKVL